jgi:hypothetical protein
MPVKPLDQRDHLKVVTVRHSQIARQRARHGTVRPFREGQLRPVKAARRGPDQEAP